MNTLENIHKIPYNPTGPEIQKILCPKCSHTRKNKKEKCLSVNIKERWFKCHNCDFHGKLDGWEPESKNYVRPQRSGWSVLGEQAANFLKGRGFGLEVVQKNRLIQRVIGDQTFIGYPYFIPEENGVVNIKWRAIEGKEFRQEKDAQRVLYNINLWGDATELIFVEGENDVIALNECGLWNVTTLSDGAINPNDSSTSGKLKSLINSSQYISHIESFVIAVDNDAPGKRLKEELISVFGATKCKWVDWNDVKDANECLLTHGAEATLQRVSEAKPVPVGGIIRVSDKIDVMMQSFREGKRMGDLTHFGEEMDNHFRWKRGQSNLWMGYANTGKSTLLLQMCIVKSIIDGWKWAVFSPEGYPAEDFYDDLACMYTGKDVTDQYGNKMMESEYAEACEFIDHHFFFIYPEDNHTVTVLHEKFEHLILKHGVDGVIIDPYNQVDKENVGERSDIEVSEFLNKVNRFAAAHNIIYNIVVHPKTINISKDTPYRPVDLHDIALGNMWGNKIWNAVSYHRPKWFENRQDSSCEIIIQKIKRRRTGGKWGTVFMDFDFTKSRFFVNTANGVKYFCDPARKAAKELNEKWQEEYKAIQPNTSFQVSSQDQKEFTEFKEAWE